MIGLRPMCDACSHLHAGEGWRCAAFPGGIPRSILGGDLDHRKHVAGDRGLSFEQNPKAQPFDFDLIAP